MPRHTNPHDYKPTALNGDLLAARARRRLAAPRRADGSHTHHAAELTAAALRLREHSRTIAIGKQLWKEHGDQAMALCLVRLRAGVDSVAAAPFEILHAFACDACDIAHSHMVNGEFEAACRCYDALLAILSEAAGAKAANPDAFSALRAEALENAAAVYAAQSDAAAARKQPVDPRAGWPQEEFERGHDEVDHRAEARDRRLQAIAWCQQAAQEYADQRHQHTALAAHLVRLASATAGQTPEAAAALHAEIEPEIYRQAARAREAEAATVSLTDRIARIEAITRRGR